MIGLVYAMYRRGFPELDKIIQSSDIQQLPVGNPKNQKTLNRIRIKNLDCLDLGHVIEDKPYYEHVGEDGYGNKANVDKRVKNIELFAVFGGNAIKVLTKNSRICIEQSRRIKGEPIGDALKLNLLSLDTIDYLAFLNYEYVFFGGFYGSDYNYHHYKHKHEKFGISIFESEMHKQNRGLIKSAKRTLQSLIQSSNNINPLIMSEPVN